MTTAVYVMTTRKGRRVERSIKTNIVGRNHLASFRQIGFRITPREFQSLLDFKKLL